MPTFWDRLKHSWNAFKDPKSTAVVLEGASSYQRPDRPYFHYGNERTIISAIYNRIAIDCASVAIRHCRVDANGRYVEDINSKLNYCLTTEANIDQASRLFFQDVVQSLCDEGCVAIVPVDTDISPYDGTFQVETLRVGKIMQWYPEHIQVRLYNQKTGNKEDIYLPKRMVAIVENPLYAVMNQPNSTLRRLIHKLGLLDAIDKQSGSGKLDLIIQLPYVIRTEQRRQQAEKRRKDIEMQLEGSKYGIAYTDGTERITQLNRPVENNLMNQITYLTTELYGQLGITDEIMKGTANAEAQQLYQSRTIEPILSAIVDEMKRKFLSKTARSQGQSIMFFLDPFKLIPVTQIADIADKFTRNEILTANEVRSIIGFRPSDDPKADQLKNSNKADNSGEVQNRINSSGQDPVPTQVDQNTVGMVDGLIRRSS